MLYRIPFTNSDACEACATKDQCHEL